MSVKLGYIQPLYAGLGTRYCDGVFVEYVSLPCNCPHCLSLEYAA